MIDKTCCVTGHRDIPADKLGAITSKLRETVLSTIENGYTLLSADSHKGWT